MAVAQKKNPKMTIQNDLDSPLAKAKRLKRVRNLAGLSRQELIEKYGREFDLNLYTYQGWEVGRHGGLSRKGAKKIVMVVAKEGVICTTEWLLYGAKPGPTVFEKFEEATRRNLNVQITPEKDEQFMQNELKVFEKLNKGAVHLFVDDDGMEPFYQKGELIAGVKYVGSTIEKLIGSDCIVKILEGPLVLRRLKAGGQKGKYNLVCMNHDTSGELVLRDVMLEFAAPVLWIRRKAL